MPYITQEQRVDLNDGAYPNDPGELAYALSTVVDEYFGQTKVNYAKYAEVIGVLETLKLEIYRRFAGPYEDKKREENGEAFLCVTADD